LFDLQVRVMETRLAPVPALALNHSRRTEKRQTLTEIESGAVESCPRSSRSTESRMGGVQCLPAGFSGGWTAAASIADSTTTTASEAVRRKPEGDMALISANTTG
jgi:hypothetical protein